MGYLTAWLVMFAFANISGLYYSKNGTQSVAQVVFGTLSLWLLYMGGAFAPLLN